MRCVKCEVQQLWGEISCGADDKKPFSLASTDQQVLAQDTVQNVRVAVAEACMGVAPTLSEETFMAHVVPLLMHFLRDEAPEVRLNVLSRLSELSSWLEALSTSLLPVVMELKDDAQWRVRQSIASLLPSIADKMGANYFQQNMQDLFFAGFSDEVAAVRMATSQAMGALLSSMGADALAQTFVPKLNEVWHDQNTTYFVKVNLLFACQALAQAQAEAGASKPAPKLVTSLKALCLKGLTDPICNVQFTAALVLAPLIPLLSDAEKGEVKAALQGLESAGKKAQNTVSNGNEKDKNSGNNDMVFLRVSYCYD